jgi:peptidoglycan/xylan/chitin deacetylase (PgdA/CDA1 family)
MNSRRKAIFTTSWDDGNPLDFRIAEMLTRYGLRGTFYVPRKISSGVMSEAQMRELGASFEIGAHTLNHVFLTTTDDTNASIEIRISRTWVQDVTGKPCTMFCPPAGKHTARHLNFVRESGYAGVRSVELMSLDRPRRTNGLSMMPTTMQSHPHGASTYLKNAMKRSSVANAWNYLAHASKGDWTKAAESMMHRAIQTGGVFHLWGHSWEIERFDQWMNLEHVLRTMGELRGEADCLTNGEVVERSISRDLIPANVA